MNLDALAHSLAGGMICRCDFGHPSHPTQTVGITLSGQPLVPDFPPIPEHLSCSFNLDVFAQTRRRQGGYCLSHGEVSSSIITQRIWEGYATLLALDHLHNTQGLVIDLGCQAGWYSMLGGLTGHEVLAVDCDPECAAVAQRNAAMNGFSLTPCFGHIDANTPALKGPVEISLLKVDIEGYEIDAVRVFGESFRRKTIEAALIEVSPVFTDVKRCQEMLEFLLSCGYGVYHVPEKGDVFDDPLVQIRRRPVEMPLQMDEQGQMDVWVSRG
ncbi:MAG TPA: FkbM family methyltransferase [Candidatus Tectomicrobia bacterium]